MINLATVSDLPKTLEDSSTMRVPTLVRTINGRSFHPLTGTPIKTTTKQEEQEQVRTINAALRKLAGAKRAAFWPYILLGAAIGAIISCFMIHALSK